MIINYKLIEKVREEAKDSPRLRMNYNFHERPDSGAQRMLNSLLPGTEIPVHRHRHTAETYIILDGNIKVSFYDDEGNVTEVFNLRPDCRGISDCNEGIDNKENSGCKKVVNSKEVEDSKRVLDLPEEGFGIHIPAGQWHGLEVLAPSTIFEVKDGPYTPLTSSDIQPI